MKNLCKWTVHLHQTRVFCTLQGRSLFGKFPVKVLISHSGRVNWFLHLTTFIRYKVEKTKCFTFKSPLCEPKLGQPAFNSATQVCSWEPLSLYYSGFPNLIHISKTATNLRHLQCTYVLCYTAEGKPLSGLLSGASPGDFVTHSIIKF